MDENWLDALLQLAWAPVPGRPAHRQLRGPQTLESACAGVAGGHAELGHLQRRARPPRPLPVWRQAGCEQHQCARRWALPRTRCCSSGTGACWRSARPRPWSAAAWQVLHAAGLAPGRRSQAQAGCAGGAAVVVMTCIMPFEVIQRRLQVRCPSGGCLAACGASVCVGGCQGPAGSCVQVQGREGHPLLYANSYGAFQWLVMQAARRPTRRWVQMRLGASSGPRA